MKCGHPLPARVPSSVIWACLPSLPASFYLHPLRDPASQVTVFSTQLPLKVPAEEPTWDKLRASSLKPGRWHSPGPSIRLEELPSPARASSIGSWVSPSCTFRFPGTNSKPSPETLGTPIASAVARQDLCHSAGVQVGDFILLPPLTLLHLGKCAEKVNSRISYFKCKWKSHYCFHF